LKRGCRALATSKNRLPSRNQLVSLFASCVFLCFTWTILNFFHKAPGWLTFLAPGEVLGAFAYALGGALLESLLVLFLLVVLAVLLPARWFGDRLVAQGTVMVLVIAFWSAVFQLIYASTPKWDPDKMLLWSVLLLLSTVISSLLLHRLECLEKVVNALVERVTVFLYLYVPMGLLGLTVVAIRNLP
jgi:hypothetical protein